MLETRLKEVITAYRNLSFCDRTAFYYSVSNDVDVSESNLQVFLFKTRLKEGSCCIYCEGEHILKNGHRKDGTQRYVCRDCKRSFIPTSFSITSGTRKRPAVWAAYIRCMMDIKTLKETSEECGISVTTAFVWWHKILDALHELTDKVYLAGTVEANGLPCPAKHIKEGQTSTPAVCHRRRSVCPAWSMTRGSRMQNRQNWEK